MEEMDANAIAQYLDEPPTAPAHDLSWVQSWPVVPYTVESSSRFHSVWRSFDYLNIEMHTIVCVCIYPRSVSVSILIHIEMLITQQLI